jgi:uncharacterized protein YbjT (DUF2867 family)
MTRPKILVTGATGKTGGAVAAQLLAAGWPVRAMVRGEDGRSEALRNAGAEIVIADMYDPEQLLAAMRGTQRAYYLTPFQPYMIQSAAAFAIAAREAKLEAVVGLSQWLASPSHPSLLTRQSWLADKLFDMVPGAVHVTINPGYFADNYLRLIDFAAQLGILPNLTGKSRNAPPSNEDIARVAVAALIDPGKHAGKSYRPTGPKLLSSGDIARILSRVLERKVRSVPMPFWLFTKAARLQGVSAYDILSLRYYAEDHRQGAFDFGAPTNDVLDLTGQPAEDFEATARRYAALPKAKRTFANGLRAWGDFMRTPLSPGDDLDRYERDMTFPMPPKPRYAMASESWKAERAKPVNGDSRVSALALGVSA